MSAPRGKLTRVLPVITLAAMGLVACADDSRDAARPEGERPARTTAASSPDTGAQPTDGADQEVAVAIQAAVEAWGRFMGTGDLAQVAPYFHPDGPQFARLREGAAAFAADPETPDRMSLVSSEVVAGSSTAVQRVVRTTVAVSGGSQAEQRFEWEVVLFRAADGRWQVWAARDVATGGGPLPADPRGAQGPESGPDHGYR